MLYLTFHPRMKKLISPQIIKFQGYLKQDMSITTLANSITLTPGTITVEVSPDGIFTVHAIDDKTASALPGEMRDKVAKTFREE
jgi:multicomponent Na+:H+ antiporter subunit E